MTEQDSSGDRQPASPPPQPPADPAGGPISNPNSIPELPYYPEREIVNHLLVCCVLSLWMQQMPEVCRPMLRRT
jgi:hypothetical protein